jgi:PAS domain S-box-containing protein
MNQRLSMRLYFGLFSIIAGMLIVLFYYFAHRIVEAENSTKAVMAQMTSKAVLDKIDRNFYERYGDVQAFAYNRLATEALGPQASTVAIEDFMNRMIQYYELYDLMLLCNKEGKIVAVNTRNVQGNPIQSQSLMGATIASTGWFKACTDTSIQGAWYSGFTVNLYVAQLYKSSGQGVGFACPVRNAAGEVIGVWYNFANWQATAEKIRMEAETELKQTDANARVVLTNAKGETLQATDQSLFYKNKPELFYQTEVLAMARKPDMPAYDKIISQQAQSKGAYSFKGNRWKAITLLTKTDVTWTTFFSGEMLWVVLVIACINILMILVVYSVVKRNFQQLHYIAHLRDIIERIARGITVHIPDSLKTKDEMGQIGQAMGKLIQALQHKTRFSDEIARGNLGATLADVHPEDTLGNSLLYMRDQLQKVEASHRINEWKAKGLSELTVLLRNNTDLATLANEVLAYLVHYLRANQGSLFITTHRAHETVLEQMACYAYSRKKVFEETYTLLPGQGLVGQAYREGSYIYLTEIPENYVRITSGLGEATPRTLLIMPLKSAKATEGVLEIASFRPIKPHEIEFVQSLAETIAAILYDRKLNEQTIKLLEESQEKGEEMRAQEEEMRQNMEELVTTQEELLRKEREISTLIEGISTSLAMIEFDLDGTVLSANDNFLTLMGYSLKEITGKHHRIFVDADYADTTEYYSFWSNIRLGQTQTGRFKHVTKGNTDVWLQATYAPLKDNAGKVIRILKIASDITKEHLLEQETLERIAIMDCYEQEMKNTFEELQERRQQVEAYEEEMRHVFNDLEEYTRKIIDLEQKVYAGNPFNS